MKCNSQGEINNIDSIFVECCVADIKVRAIHEESYNEIDYSSKLSKACYWLKSNLESNISLCQTFMNLNRVQKEITQKALQFAVKESAENVCL